MTTMTTSTNGHDATLRSVEGAPLTGPGTLAGRYLRSFWQVVHRAEDLPVGRATPLRVMSEDFTLYRGEGGAAHVVPFRCAHREAQLSVGSVEGDCLRCFYHGWKYDGSGQCVEQPAEPEPFAEKVRIRTYPTREYLGLIFAYLGEGEPPEFPRFPEFEESDIALDSGMQTYLRKSNYFQNIENSLDSTHLGFVHRDHRLTFDGGVDSPVLSGEESSWGISFTARRSNGRVQRTYFGMPNTFYLNTFSRDPALNFVNHLFWYTPIDDEQHIQYGVGRIPLAGEAAEQYFAREDARRAKLDVDHNEVAQAILAGKIRLDDVDTTRTDLVMLQDDIAQRGQGVIQARTNERLGRGDAGVILLRKLWARELRAFAEGRPLKQWGRTPDMRPHAWQEEPAAGVASA